MSDPSSKLGTLSKYLTNVNNKKIANLLGSNGTKAVSLALMGANVSVVDFSFENSRYALDLARECDVKINYIVSDVLKMPEEELSGDYDIVFCELGILHYFTDLNPFLKLHLSFYVKEVLS